MDGGLSQNSNYAKRGSPESKSTNGKPVVEKIRQQSAKGAEKAPFYYVIVMYRDVYDIAGEYKS